MGSASEEADGADRLAYERVLFFSDAVFAIAITLLVLDLRPADIMTSSGAVHWRLFVSKLTGFGLSFYVISQYWMAHRNLFAPIQACDSPLVAVNLVFLAAIAFMPFPTSAVVAAPPARGPVMLYLGSLLVVAATMLALIRTARRSKLLKAGADPGETARIVARSAAPASVFVIALVVAAFDPRAGLWTLLLLFPAGLVSARIGRRVAKAEPR